jgi:hypothetical protein
LSPPWGGVEYKDSETYSIKEMMKPSIFDIIRVCLSIAKNIIFYLPRTILLEEFYEILSTCLNKEFDIIYTDIHILNSANKIKAIMLVFGQDINKLQYKDINKHIKSKYKFNDENTFNNLCNIMKTIGVSKFLKSESQFFKTAENDKLGEDLVNFLKEKILTPSDVNKIKLLESLENFDRNKGRKFQIQIFEDGKNCEEEFKRSR